MPTAAVNGVRLFYARTGTAGPPLVLVHGAWGDHASWDAVVPILAQRFRVLAYDRRGHSQSERLPGPGSIEEDVDDLTGLLEHLGLAPAHVAGVSFGGKIALRLAARRPDLVRSLAVHEPGLFVLLADDPEQGAGMREMLAIFGTVADRLAAGDIEGGIRQFMETVLPGRWEQLPPAGRQRYVFNAPTFVDDARDPASYTFDLAALAGVRCPVLLTYGDQSPACFPPVVAQLAAVLPHAETRVFAGAGHVPAQTHPAEYVAAVVAFAEAAKATEDGGPN
jgi:pimeloyl-ACP methyl ester carboxylesterase